MLNLNHAEAHIVLLVTTYINCGQNKKSGLQIRICESSIRCVRDETIQGVCRTKRWTVQGEIPGQHQVEEKRRETLGKKLKKK